MLGALHSIIAGSSSVASVVISIAFMLFLDLQWLESQSY